MGQIPEFCFFHQITSQNDSKVAGKQNKDETSLVSSLRALHGGPGEIEQSR
jgi:hypothetical protein